MSVMPREKDSISKVSYVVISAVVIFIATAALYWKYLLGLTIYIHPQMIADEINQFYPAQIDAARNFAKYGTTNFYSFSNGFGIYRNYMSPFFIILFLFGEESVPYMMGFKVALCVFLSGWLMGLFLREAGYKASTCFFGALGYAFSMQTVISGSYRYQGEMALIAALTLYAIEKCIHKKKSGAVLLAFSVVLAYLSMNFYYYLIYGGAAAVYVVVRIFYINQGWARLSSKARILFGGVAGTSLFAGIAVIFPKMKGIFSSTRFQMGLQNWSEQWKNTFSSDNLQAILNFGYRTIAPNILGVWDMEQEYGHPFRDARDDSGFYVGLLTVLILSLLVKARGKKRVYRTSVVILTLLGVLVCFPGIRLLANGFSGTNFKLIRLLGTLVFVGVAAYVWNEFFGKNRKIEMVPVLLTDALIALAVLIPVCVNRKCLYPWDVVRVLLFLALYTGTFMLWNAGEQMRPVIKPLLLALFAVEVISFNYRFTNNEDALTREELESGYYNDGTIEVIDEIRSLEKENPFYRVNKSYESLLYSDAEVQGYYGTAFYRGGADDKNMTDFVKNFAVPTKSNILALCTGSYGYPALSAGCGVRYGISDKAYMEPGYQYVERIGEKNLYKNENALPPGYVYSNVISQEEMEHYTVKQRHDILLQACVLEQEVTENTKTILDGMSEFTPDFNQAEVKREYHFIDYEMGTPLEFEPLTSDEMLVVNLKNKTPASIQLYWSSADGGWSDKDRRIVSIYDRNQETFAEIANQEEIYGVIFYCIEDVQTIDEVSLYVYSEEEYNRFQKEKTDCLRENSMELYVTETGEFQGKITAEDSGILYLSIPYDAPYEYYLNGEQCDTLRANYIFTGIIIEAGEYQLEMRERAD